MQIPYPWGRTQGLKDALIHSEGVVGLCIDRCINALLISVSLNQSSSVNRPNLRRDKLNSQFIVAKFSILHAVGRSVIIQISN